MDLVFTPDGYRNVISNRGRDVDLRDVDVVHLNVAGAVIAAKLVAPALGEPWIASSSRCFAEAGAATARAAIGSGAPGG